MKKPVKKTARKQVKATAKRQGVALVVGPKKKKTKAPVKRVKKELSEADKNFNAFKKHHAPGNCFFLPGIGPIRVTKVEKGLDSGGNTAKVSYDYVTANHTDGSSKKESNVRFEYLDVRRPVFDVKNFLKEIGSLYKKTYLS